MHGTRVGLAVVVGMMMAMSAMGANASQPIERGISYEDAARASFPELLEFLALPNDAIAPADIRANVAWLERAFAKRGFTTKQLPNDGKPLLFAEYGKPMPGRKTLLFYMHFDGQPVLPEQWAQPSPWQPVVKKRNAAGAWEIVPTTRLQDTPLDPELRVFARSASDDKGPIMMLLAAFDTLRSADAEPRNHIKVILDSEEEKGSPGLGAVAKAHADLLRSDGLLIFDGPRHASGRPTLAFGNRGNALATLTVYGPRNPLHSGHYGNYAPNPAQRLAALLASMKDDDGRVTIDGYYDRVVLSDGERAILAEVGDDEAAIRKRIGIARAEGVAPNYQEAMQYPSLTIRGLQSAVVGEKGANIVPHKAVAELDLRTTPEAGPDHLFGLLQAHVRKQGWHLVDGEPTEVDRATYDRIASLTYEGGGGDAARTPMDAPIGAWAYTVLGRSFGDAPDMQPVRIRMMGGSLPTDELVSALKVPFVIVPLVNGDNNQHSFDENLRVGNYVDGVKTIVLLTMTLIDR
ncbi:MAG: M20/M25/M40 family metallo-hydrolase [Xanthomonadaceae bacterium]|nr:M20/M25/M40 family metallo-hydrolase [Xanthomonadaceae bacterium]